MNKFLSVLLMLVMIAIAIGLVACDSGKKGGDEDKCGIRKNNKKCYRNCDSIFVYYAFALSSAKISLRRSSVVGFASLSSLAASAASASAFFLASTFSAMYA